MKAIPTTYRGTPFRSRLEAQWAEFFDALSIAWQYEPEGYTNGSVCYLPDFWLPSVWHRAQRQGVFFEVKPSSPLAGEIEKAVMLACGSGRPVILAAAPPKPPDFESLQDYFKSGRLDWEDSGLVLAMCDACGSVDVGFYGREPSCPCGRDTFSAYTGRLNAARNAFPRFGQWKRTA